MYHAREDNDRKQISKISWNWKRPLPVLILCCRYAGFQLVRINLDQVMFEHTHRFVNDESGSGNFIKALYLFFDMWDNENTIRNKKDAITTKQEPFEISALVNSSS